jgi:hypothetical protein
MPVLIAAWLPLIRDALRMPADQRAAGEHRLGQRHQSARGDRSRPVGQPLAALEGAADRRMGLVALELLERRQPGVLVGQSDHEAHRDLVVAEVVEEGAAVGVGVERPACGVHDEAAAVPGRLDLPQLLDPDAVRLRVGAGGKLVSGHQLPAEMAARALGEQRVLGEQLDARLEGLGRLAVAPDAHAAGGHAAHRAALVVQDLGGREPGIDLDPEGLGLLAQPAHQVAEAADVVAVVPQAARDRPLRRRDRLRRREEQHLVLGHLGLEGRAPGLPVGEQLGQRARIEHRARQRVRAELRAFFDHAHPDVAAALGGQLLQPDRRAQPRRPATDNQHVELHRIPLSVHDLVL